MFGYIVADARSLAKAEKDRYRAAYCGLCRRLRLDYGQAARSELSYDMAFVAMLLASAEGLEETSCSERCAMRPFRHHSHIETEATQYAAAMNVLLAYHKRLDDWRDERSYRALAKSRRLEAALPGIRERWPVQCEAVERCLDALSRMEQSNELNPDIPANCFGELMGAIFDWRSGAGGGTGAAAVADGACVACETCEAGEAGETCKAGKAGGASMAGAASVADGAGEAGGSSVACVADEAAVAGKAGEAGKAGGADDAAGASMAGAASVAGEADEAGGSSVACEALRKVGESLGRFVYLMDACIDLRSDIRKERYNPLVAQSGDGFFPMLSLMAGECAQEFEKLPLARDVGIFRNVIYSGIWTRYRMRKALDNRLFRGSRHR